jgi:D-beta-D-heptose 7-phosphate kinase/D-beta-D-heptose 1-phosphate adenosyltransferase
MKLVIASGYFNPLHRGHVSYLEEAKKLGDKLFVIVNNDMQVKLKGSKEFLDEKERELIVKALRVVDFAQVSSSHDKSVGSDLVDIRKKFSKDKLVFAKGGDRVLGNLPQSEIDACKNGNIEMVFNVGEEKIQSSSKILEKMHSK